MSNAVSTICHACRNLADPISTSVDFCSVAGDLPGASAPDWLSCALGTVYPDGAMLDRRLAETCVVAPQRDRRGGLLPRLTVFPSAAMTAVQFAVRRWSHHAAENRTGCCCLLRPAKMIPRRPLDFFPVRLPQYRDWQSGFSVTSNPGTPDRRIDAVGNVSAEQSAQATHCGGRRWTSRCYSAC